MSRQRVAFPSFRIEEAIKPYDMRQLVAALEYRFQSLEEQESTIPDTTFADDLDALYAPIIHTHVVADILDFDENVPSSIFDLDDVNGVPTVGQSLIWDGDEFLPGTAGGSLALSELTDVYVPTPTDTQVLTWVDVNNRWEALDVGSIGGGVDNLLELDDTDLTTQTAFDMLYNDDGANWHDTASLLKWNPYEGYLQLAGGTSINWLDDVFNSVEFVTFTSAVGGTDLPDVDTLSFVATTTSGDLVDQMAAICFNPDGSILYILGRRDDPVISYTLSTPFDLTTLVTPALDTSPFNMNDGGSNVENMQWSPDGLTLSIMKDTGQTLKSWDITTPYDLSELATFNAEDRSTSFSAMGGLQDWDWSADGLFLMVCSDTGRVKCYTLSVAFDQTTKVEVNVGQFIHDAAWNLQGIAVSDDGMKYWVMDVTNNKIRQFLMSSPWDESTASLDTPELDLTMSATVPYSIYNDKINGFFHVGYFGAFGVNDCIVEQYSYIGSAALASSFTLGDPAHTTRIDGSEIVIANDIGINWEDSATTPRELLVFSGALAGTPISYAAVSVNAATQLSTSGFATIAGMTIDQTTLVSGDDYLVVAHGNFDTDNSNGVFTFVKLIDAQGATLPGTNSDNEVEPNQGNQDDTSGVFQQFTAVFTCDHTGTGLLEMQAHETGLTSTYQKANNMSMFVMNLTQFGADAQWDYVSGFATTYNGGVYGGLGNTLTIGDGVSDYLLIGSATTVSASGSSTANMAFRIGGVVTENLNAITRSHSQERRVASAMWVVEAPAASTVVEFVGTTGTFGRFVHFNITAIRLDAFTQYESSIVADPPEATADVIYDMDTLSFTSSAASGPWAFFSSRTVNNADIRGESLVSVNSGTRQLTAFDLGYQQDQAGWGTSLEFPDVFPTIEPGDTVDMYLSHNPTSSFASDGITQSVAIAVPMTLGGSSTSIFEAGDPAFDTKIDGLTTTIRSVATDIDGTLNVDGAATFVSTLNAQGAVDFDVTLNVDGAVTFVDTLNVQGAVDFDTTLNVDGATTLVGTLNGQGAVDFDTTLNVDGVASFQADLDLSAVSAINIDSNEIAVLIPAVDASSGGAGGDADWSSVSLLANFDGADADVIYTSEDDALRVATFVGTAALDTAQFQFGTSSLLLDGNSDYVTFPDDADWEFGSGDFTVECWARHASAGATQYYVSHYDLNGVSQASWAIAWSSSQVGLVFVSSAAGSGDIAVMLPTTTWTPTLNTWHHIVASRVSGTMYMYVDGVLKTTGALATNLHDSTSTLDVGIIRGAAGPASYFDGWIDDVRITKSVGRHAVDFTAPIEAYSDFDNYWNIVAIQHDFAGADTATTAVDVKDTTRIPTFFGTAAIDTAISKFGGSSLLLDGNSDYVTIPHSIATRLLNGEDLTVEFWIRPDSLLTSNRVILNKGGIQGSVWPNYSMGYIATTGLLSWTIYFNGGSGVNATSTTGLVVDTWTHVAGVWDDANDTAQIYINGVREASDQNTFTIYSTANALSIGHQASGTGDYTEGRIDDLRITRGVRYGNFAVPNREYVAADNADAVIVNFNGADAATTYTTDDSTALTVTFFGSTALDDAQRRFGSTSLTVPAAADYVSIPSDAATQFGSGDFGVEVWIRPSGITGTDIIYDQRSTGTQQAMTIYLAIGVPYIFVNGANRINGPTALTVNTWYHLCVQRESGVTRMFLDGAQIGIDYTDTNVYVANPIFFGRDWTNTANGFDGWLDSLRILVGAPLYPVNFLPPTLETPAEDSSWSNVSFLASFDGVDGDVVYTSDDSAGRVATFFGAAVLDDAQARFGSTSLLGDGSTSYLTFPTSTDFDLAADDFTVECWVMHNDAANIEYYVGHYDSAIANARHWSFGYDGVADTINFITSVDGTTVVTFSSSTYVPSTGVWIHYAACRVGGNLRMYADGVEYYNVANTTNIHYTSGTTLDIGALHGGSGLIHWQDGWIDEVRVTKGIGRYAAAFTPPPRAFLRDTPAATDPVAAELAIYTVGDALLDTQIDGVETTVTGELTFLDKLNASVITVITTSYTAGAEHVILVDDDTAGGTVTITLPAVADGNTLYHIKKVGSTAPVIIEGDGAELVEGALTATLTIKDEAVMLVPDGVSWHVI